MCAEHSLPAQHDQPPIVRLQQVQFAWRPDTDTVLDIPEFTVQQSEKLFLQGPSGSGKTTLLSLIAAVLVPQAGTIEVDGVNLASLKSYQRDRFRADRIGLVFQQFNLLPFLTVRENIQLPCQFSKDRSARAQHAGWSLNEETDRLLNAMRLPPAEVINKPVTDLSVGQQQRVAVARALIGKPPLIIADEPTSALDSETREAFLTLLFDEVKSAGSSLLFVSHDAALASAFDRHVDLRAINTVSAPGELT
jgi:putative ABC transport system ATP-binding protein